MRRKPEKVYHASQVQGLKRIVPRRSTHGQPWIYATRDPVMAAVFLGTRGGDFTCAVGRDPEIGKPFICERFAGAFELRYANVQGSIYVLPGEKFVAGKTSWDEELVCAEPVTPLEEIRIADAKNYLLELARAGELIIKLYPEKIAGIPEDDEDLIYRAVVWSRRFGKGVIEKLRKYHPHLVPRVERALKEGKYRDAEF